MRYAQGISSITVLMWMWLSNEKLSTKLRAKYKTFYLDSRVVPCCSSMYLVYEPFGCCFWASAVSLQQRIVANANLARRMLLGGFLESCLTIAKRILRLPQETVTESRLTNERRRGRACEMWHKVVQTMVRCSTMLRTAAAVNPLYYLSLKRLKGPLK